MKAEEQLKKGTVDAVNHLYGVDMNISQINVNQTRKEFEGDLTVVIFPIVKIAKKKPEDVGQSIGEYLKKEVDFVEDYNVVKGFLNLVFTDEFWLEKFGAIASNPDPGQLPSNGKKVVLEYVGPNTNKPLHLGHVRNMVLGYSMAEILKANGYQVHKVNIINDRGIAICKSMLAWQKFGNGETPESTKTKGDHFVGSYYVKFNTELGKEYSAWQETKEAKKVFDTWLGSAAGKKEKEAGKSADDLKKSWVLKYKNDYFNEYSELGKTSRDMLVKWEANDKETVALWEKMNQWVYDGFDQTYKRLGIDFEEVYHESKYYKNGKQSVQQGLKDGVFYQKEDGSIWADLEDYKLDHKLVLRGDGTSVYLTQDIAVAEARNKKYGMDLSIYTVGNEQNYHFQVLKAVLQKMGRKYADGIYHLSYGMVELPTGKMKSREGTVVDADDLIEDVVLRAKEKTIESGKIDDFSKEDANQLFEKIGQGALRFNMLHVGAKKSIMFNPEESVELEGTTGPFIQYSFVRTQSVLRKYGKEIPSEIEIPVLDDIERSLIIMLNNFDDTVKNAAEEFDPAGLASYTYNLAKLYNQFYNKLPILKSDVPESTKDFRVLLSYTVGNVLKKGLGLLGIDTPERM